VEDRSALSALDGAWRHMYDRIHFFTRLTFVVTPAPSGFDTSPQLSERGLLAFERNGHIITPALCTGPEMEHVAKVVRAGEEAVTLIRD
jgi:hypothetical protein